VRRAAFLGLVWISEFLNRRFKFIDARRAGHSDAANDIRADLDWQTARNCNNAGQRRAGQCRRQDHVIVREERSHFASHGMRGRDCFDVFDAAQLQSHFSL